MNYCKRKIKSNDCDDMDGSMIFQSGSNYLQWMCNQMQGHNIQKYFRVISRKDDDSIDIGTITDRYGATFRSDSNDIVTIMDRYGATSSSDTMDNVTDIPFRHDAMLFTDLCIKLIIGVAAFLGTVIVFLLVVVYILRRKLRKASYTCLTVRRDQNTYNEITTHLSDADQYHEILPLSEMSASGSRPPRSPSIDRKQNVDSSGYLILSSSFKRNEKQCDST
ncbi:unnamed protein product [Mytilus edulis]|uniref:Uncharacterized protein n=1 Tax=Mytilus edulis TaxID=6550 RepID=A0A8S3RUT7_MYTED|nr:unnamed protein product [Mytilus edulis]